MQHKISSIGIFLWGHSMYTEKIYRCSLGGRMKVSESPTFLKS